jgi:hypothetical protein
MSLDCFVAALLAMTCGQVAPKSSLNLPATDPAARLPLALYRERMDINSYPFALLNFTTSWTVSTSG